MQNRLEFYPVGLLYFILFMISQLNEVNNSIKRTNKQICQL